MFSYSYHICVTSLPALELAAQQLAAALMLTDRLGLDGALGVGKTIFCQALGQALGVCQAMTSPTFTLLHYYESSLGQLAHMDWYRLESENTTHSILPEVEELLETQKTLCLVEWPCLAPPLFAEELTLHLELSYGSQPEERLLQLYSQRPLLTLKEWEQQYLEPAIDSFALLVGLNKKL